MGKLYSSLQGAVQFLHQGGTWYKELEKHWVSWSVSSVTCDLQIGMKCYFCPDFTDSVWMCVCPSGGFSDTYAALCDFNEMPSREEIQWVSHRWPTTWNALMHQRKKNSVTLHSRLKISKSQHGCISDAQRCVLAGCWQHLPHQQLETLQPAGLQPLREQVWYSMVLFDPIQSSRTLFKLLSLFLH